MAAFGSADKLSGIPVVDLHGKNSYQAKIAVNAALRRAKGAYRIRVVHGHNGGTVLRDMLRDEFSCDSRVKRMISVNSGTTDLVLKEL